MKKRSLPFLWLSACAIVIGGCAPNLDSRWVGLPPLTEAPDTTLPADLRALIEQAEAKPQSADAQLALAANLAKRRLFSDAVAALGNALAVDPSDQRTLDLLMLVARTDREPRTLVIQLCRRILARNPLNRGALWVLGELGVEDGQLDQSRVLLERAWEQEPRSWRMAISLARLEALQLNRAEALAWCAEAARLAPNDAVANAALAEVYLAAGDVERASMRAMRAVVLNPDQPEARIILGRAYLARRDLTAAVSAFRKAIDLASSAESNRPADLRRQSHAQRAYYLLGQTYMALGKDAEAVQALERAFDYERRGLPMLAEARLNLAMAYQRLGRMDDAIEQYQRMVQADKAPPAALNNLAFLYAERGDHLDEALQHAKTALDLIPSFVTHDTLGWVHFRRGEYELAIENLENARQEAPHNPEVLRHLALAYSKTERAPEGAKLLREAYQLAKGTLRATIKNELPTVEMRAKRQQGSSQ
ncbi:MAG: tetratricopeptide repeat protein [Candidatus Zipacnadales bacterium]